MRTIVLLLTLEVFVQTILPTIEVATVVDTPEFFSVNDYICEEEVEEEPLKVVCMQSDEIVKGSYRDPDMQVVEEETDICTYDNIELLAIIVMAEAENQPEYGKRLVIDVILNRVDSDRFPNSVWDVIYSPEQFTCVLNGRADICYVKDEIVQLIYEEIENRSNYEVVFFRTKGFPTTYGTPLFQYGDHYFSGL